MGVFVFGSNLAGRHGKGAARYAAEHHGAIYGQGEGRQGNSYAIPTKDQNIKTLHWGQIDLAIGRFCEYAREHPDTEFHLTPVGCGLAGYEKRDLIGSLRRHQMPANVFLTSSWVAD